MAKMLLVEDDESIARSIEDWLKDQPYVLEISNDGADAYERLKHFGYDLLILDWELPNRPGVQLCADYRAAGGKAPVLMLTARKDIADREFGLDTGADDYLTKPFEMRDLSARIRALLRRSTGYFDNSLEEGKLKLEHGTLSIKVGDKSIRLLPSEFALLEFLMRNSDKFVSSENLLSHVWTIDSEASEQALRTCVFRLRKKLDEKGSGITIESAKGFGYRIISS